MRVKKYILIEIVLLELVSYVPIAIIAGNILPSIGFIKIHWLYIGLVMLFTLLSLLKTKTTNGLFLVIGFFATIQLVTAINFSSVAFIDFISGPLLFIAIVNIVVSDKVDIFTLRHYRAKMLFGLSVPIFIAFLQFLGILPLEFLNATYVNLTLYGTEVLKRVNGFLYHGIELAVIIFFFFANLSFLTTHVRAYIILAMMLIMEYVTLIKSGILSAILFTGYYSYLIDRHLRSFKSLAIAVALFLGFSYIYVLVPDLQAGRFTFSKNDFKFEDQLLTGRGFIWNVYVDGIQEQFNLARVFFGGGFGSGPMVFRAGLFGADLPNNWSPGPHNQLLELFVNGGLFAIFIIVLILWKQHCKMLAYFADNREKYRTYFLAVVWIPLLVMGTTAPIMSMFVYWCALSLSVVNLKLSFTT